MSVTHTQLPSYGHLKKRYNVHSSMLLVKTVGETACFQSCHELLLCLPDKDYRTCNCIVTYMLGTEEVKRKQISVTQERQRHAVNNNVKQLK